MVLAACVSSTMPVRWTTNCELRSWSSSRLVVNNLQHWDYGPGLRRPAGARSRWPPLVPRPLTYSSNISDVDPVELSELWAITLKVVRDPKKIMKALRHTYAFVVVLAEDEDSAFASSTGRRLIGIGRAVSDGAFIATICDVAVHPDYQHRGIGRKIVKQLVQDMKSKGGPSGFAVFPPPSARRFFWMIGFRAEKKYRIMAYREKVDRDLPVDKEACS